MGVNLKLMGFEGCKFGQQPGITYWILWPNTPPGRSPMNSDNMSAFSGFASFAKVQDLLVARSHEGSA